MATLQAMAGSVKLVDFQQERSAGQVRGTANKGGRQPGGAACPASDGSAWVALQLQSASLPPLPPLALLAPSP